MKTINFYKKEKYLNSNIEIHKFYCLTIIEITLLNLNSNIEIHKSINQVNKLCQKEPHLNSNIEIHKYKWRSSIMEAIKNLNSNIEIHKLSDSDKKEVPTVKFKF